MESGLWKGRKTLSPFELIALRRMTRGSLNRKLSVACAAEVFRVGDVAGVVLHRLIITAINEKVQPMLPRTSEVADPTSAAPPISVPA